MRTKIELNLLLDKKKQSYNSPVDYTNHRNERFIFENGQLIAYANQKVIEPETDRLVNLAEYPYVD